MTYPLNVVYCGVCGLPPEYAMFQRDYPLDDCKRWLEEHHPDLYTKIYEEGDEESKDQKKMKKKKKVVFAVDAEKKIKVICQKRGGKKVVSSILGLDSYGIDLADCAKQMSKKMGSGAASMLIEFQEISA